jgi:hypothetical protein
MWIEIPDTSRCLEPIQARHQEIEHDDVGLEAVDELQRFP